LDSALSILADLYNKCNFLSKVASWYG